MGIAMANLHISWLRVESDGIISFNLGYEVCTSLFHLYWNTLIKIIFVFLSIINIDLLNLQMKPYQESKVYILTAFVF
jgi:hypothetical protein